MQLINKTRNQVLASDLKVADSLSDRLFGLLKKNNPRTLLFKTRFGIHTFFLKEPIDILVINPKSKIVKVKKSLGTNKLFFWNPKYTKVVELPKNTIKNTETQVGDSLVIN